MKIYTQDGLIIHTPTAIFNNHNFYIQDFEIEGLNKTVTMYSNDSIMYEIDNELVALSDLFMDKLFNDIDNYYNQLSRLPMWIPKAGHESNITMSATDFAKHVEKSGSSIPDFYKHLYLVDCQFLIGSVQNLLAALDDNLIRYFKLISEMDPEIDNFLHKDNIIEISNTTSIQAAQCVESYFIKAFAILDRLCKICYEFEKLKTDFSAYPKLSSADVQWRERKKLSFIKDEEKTKETLFEKCEFVSEIEAMRHEVVHNGSWELRPIKYVKIENQKVIKQYMMFPEFRDGHLASVKNRKHFFPSETTINEQLPQIHSEFKKRLLTTTIFIRQYYCNSPCR